MAKQSKAQKDTVERVMHEFKHGELKSGSGRKVKNPKQAVAIALNESGSSKYNSGAENKRKLAQTKRRERTGKTGQAEAEGRGKSASRSAATKPSSKSAGASGKSERSKAELYAEAKRRDISGRSRMSKDDLARALA